MPVIGNFQIACHSVAGKLREDNQDACALSTPGPLQTRWGTLVALADGVGGLPGGSAASQDAVLYLQALYYAGTGASHPADRLRECVEAVNALNRLAAQPLNGVQGRLTTLIAAVLREEDIWLANVGDSRAYLIEAGQADRKQLTQDHVTSSAPGSLGTSGVQVFEQGIPEQPRISRAIGMEDRCQVDIYHYTWKPGDSLVLCSDGLEGLSSENMVELALQFPADQAAQALVERAVAEDGSDNCTAIVAQWGAKKPGARPDLLESEAPPTEPLASLSAIDFIQNRDLSKPVPPNLPGRSQLWLWFLIGLMAGWLSAAVVLSLLLNS